jgi:CBS domain-containing protein
VGRSLSSSRVDTSLICKRFGGGGHRTASAASIRNRTAIEVREELFAYICMAVRAHQTLEEVLTAPSVSLRADETISNATLLFVRLNLKKVPVVDRVGHVVGIMDRVASEKARQHKLGDSLVADFMETDVHCLTVDSSVEKVIELILRRHQRLVPILDQYLEATPPKRMMEEDQSESELKSKSDSDMEQGSDHEEHTPPSGSTPIVISRASMLQSNTLRVSELPTEHPAASPLSPAPILDAEFLSHPLSTSASTTTTTTSSSSTSPRPSCAAQRSKAKVPALVGVVTRADVVALLLREPSRFPSSVAPDRVVTNEMNQLLPRSILTLLRTAGKLADQLGIKVYVVGGFVRDLLLSHDNDDVDLVVEGDGISFAEELNSRCLCVRARGSRACAC